MNLVSLALRRPYSILVVVLAVMAGAVLTVRAMPRDIFPDLGVPTIYVAQPYGGMDPAQMEGFLTYYYEYHFLYITGIEHVESKSIQGAALIKLQFHAGTDMAQALAETVAYVNRARAFMPPGTVPPFVTRFDAGSVAVGYLAFASQTKSVSQLQDLALNTVRPLFATLPGVSAPPPFGGSPRTIVVALDAEKLQAYRLSAQDVVSAISNAETISPSGNINLNGLYPAVPVNSIVKNVQDLGGVAVRAGTFPAVFVRDLGQVSDAADIPTSLALVDGRPTVYIPVTKRADASTLAVVDLVRANLGKFQAALPDDVRVSYVFDQSPLVTRAIAALLIEGLLGALLAGAMVLWFLRNVRSALIVLLTIPLSLLAALPALWWSGQTVNIMTLGGLVLAVGILVDMSTVAIENIRTHLQQQSAARAVLDSGREVAAPMGLATLCILAVFVPALGMQGPARALFLPLSLAVGFAVLAAFLLANTLVPVLAVWAFRQRPAPAADPHVRVGLLARLQDAYQRQVNTLIARRAPTLIGYGLLCLVLVTVFLPRLGGDIFPRVDSGQLQLRLRAPAGTQLQRTAAMARQALGIIGEEVGTGNVELSLALVGVHGSAYPINFIHQWTSGPQEGVLQVQLRAERDANMGALRERLRARFAKDLPAVQFSFEPADLISRVMSFGANTPIEVAVSGPGLDADRAYAERVRARLASLPMLRDVQFGQPLDYPAVQVTIDRERGGLMGLTTNDLTRSLAPVTSSSRFTQPLYWAGANGVAYQVQVQVPQAQVNSLEDINNVQVSNDHGGSTALRNIAQVQSGSITGEFDRYNMARLVSVTANIEGTDLATAASAVRSALDELPQPPPKVAVVVRGELTALDELQSALARALLLATGLILLLLVAYFQSWQLALIVLATLPAVAAGVTTTLWLTHSTLNVESFIGTIMAVGVAVANAILLVTFAERARLAGQPSAAAALAGATSRWRPIMMTSLAMMVGMFPMALGIGASAQQTAPLARAVIGGLACATLGTLLVLPPLFAWVRERTTRVLPSLHPDDRELPMKEDA